MQFDKITLLCTFTPEDRFHSTLDSISQTYTLPHGTVYVLTSPSHPGNFYCTFNAVVPSGTTHMANTIPINRKKQTNTLYTINALNTYVKSHTGSSDDTYIVDWEAFRNMLLICTQDTDKKETGTLTIIHTKLFKIVEFNQMYR